MADTYPTSMYQGGISRQLLGERGIQQQLDLQRPIAMDQDMGLSTAQRRQRHGYQFLAPQEHLEVSCKNEYQY